MSNNGNMIMSNNPTINMINNHTGNNTNMPMSMMDGMGNPYYMTPYVGYPPIMQPMLNYNNYRSSPMYYNPYQMANNIPLNNYNRNLAGNINYNNNNYNSNLPFQNYNHNQSAPIKLIAHTQPYIPGGQENLYSQQIIQRSISSKGARDNSQLINNHYINNNVSSYRGDGPSTNPESFSRRRGYSSNSNSNLNDGGFKPYSLKDYKDITAAKVVLGGLGPNIGTKEWMEKQEKKKKMEEYSKNVKGKPIIKFVKETPTEIVEKIKKEKIETSNRFKSYEYAKLIRQKPKSSLDSNANYLNQDILSNELHIDNSSIKNDEEILYNNNHNNLASNTRTQNLNRIEMKNKHNINNKLYKEQNNNKRYPEENSNQNISNYSRGENLSNNNNPRDNYDYKYNEADNSNKDDLEFLKIQKQRELLNLKLNEIKESLLK